MEARHAPLFTPLQIGGVTIKNRIVLCAMEGTNLIEFMPHYHFNAGCRQYYLERASHEVALMIPGMVPIRGLGAGPWLHEQEELFLGPVTDLMGEIHDLGSQVFLQIGAGMGRVMPAMAELQEMYKDPEKKARAKAAGFDIERVFEGPSAGLPNVWDPDITTVEMTGDQIREVIDAFGRSAALCQRAGIDGVEIHAVHEGYLLDQFTQSALNHRADEFGGSLENRYRFTTEIIRAIKAACGQDYPVSVRFSVESKMRGFNAGAVPGEVYTEFGRDRQESRAAARLLEAAGADLLDADNGSYDSWFWAHPPMYMPLACNLEDAAFIKESVTIPVVVAGRMEDPDTAAAAVAAGQVDGVGIARQLLADGAYVAKVKSGRLADIRPCIACHNGCFPVSRHKGLAAGFPSWSLGRCAINPASLAENEHEIRPAGIRKRVAVIGGGIGGMETARVLALRGHAVTLYEKTRTLGGVFVAAAAPDFKEKDKMLIDWYRHQVATLPITVRLDTEIGTADAVALDVDAVIVATGASARALPIPGIENDNVVEAVDYLSGDKQDARDVVVIGGGLTGCEIAYDIALKGGRPVVVEAQDDILTTPNLSAANSNMLRELIRFHEIPVHLSTRVLEITEDGVIVQTPTGAQLRLDADAVVLSVGYVSGSLLATGDTGTISIVGDAHAVGNLKDVIWRANEIALHL
ncbi:MAG TPA: FAD-dependent oxidoreductase [Cellulomonas sp.]